LSKEENQLCKLRLDDGCKFVAECVDHIVAVKGASDPLFWEPSNHQASCLHCNTVKGKRTIEGSDWDGDYNTASNRNTEKHNKKDGLGY
jgi:5-methylcytosine-specific restriction endonuclease McrA